MPIEIVRSPNTGVTLSLASQSFWAGHKLAFTFDAIRTDSPAYEALVVELESEIEQERVRKQKEALRKDIRIGNIHHKLNDPWWTAAVRRLGERLAIVHERIADRFKTYNEAKQQVATKVQREQQKAEESAR